MSAPPEEGQQAPDFTLPSTQGQVSLRQLRQAGKVVIAFYTEDLTPG